MRLFCAVELPETLRAALATAVAGLRLPLERAGADVRWTPAENLHVTMWFFGDLPADAAAALQAALSRPIPQRPFGIGVGGVGVFPPAGAPRILWAGVREGADALQQTRAALAARLAGLGYTADRDTFHPHVTIGRVRARPTRAGAAAMRQAELADLGGHGRARVEALTLFQSRLSARGAQHEPLQRVPLEG